MAHPEIVPTPADQRIELLDVMVEGTVTVTVPSRAQVGVLEVLDRSRIGAPAEVRFDPLRTSRGWRTDARRVQE